ncbi:hypothetical protein LSUE1_G006243 [Lachnellula suecica]|uniref:Uncharacterized protein n=1 Tax=Lachnellula suecica TaxID=602035 RepID=A0A8T9C2J5_9HELO|nr:hypothetical protein LSUE1_G006243 [Lachnellula suecica]
MTTNIQTLIATRKPTPLPDYYIRGVACLALEELWTVSILPDIGIDPSITLSHATRSSLREIVSGLTREETLFLCCVKWEFNSNDDIDRTWIFRRYAFSNEGILHPYIMSSVRRYNKMGGEMTVAIGFELFSSLKEKSEERLSAQKYLDIDRTLPGLAVQPKPDQAAYVEFLVHQTYDFCWACINDTKFDLNRPIMKSWFKNAGWIE